MTSPSGRVPRWLLGVAALALGLRLFRLGHPSLWIDELISLQLATYERGAAFWRGLLTDIHGPFNSVLLHLWTAGGTGETWLRLLYVIPGVAAVPVVWRLGAELFDERSGRTAAFLLAVSPFHVWYSQEVRSYAWAILWIASALLAFVRILDGRGGARAWAALAVLCPLALLTNFSAVFLLAGITAVLAFRRPFPRRDAVRWAAVLALSGATFLPWFLDWYGRIGGERIFVDAPSPTGMPLREDSGFSWSEVPYVAWSFAYGYTLGPSLRSLHLDRSADALAPYLPLALAGAVAAAAPLAGGIRAARGRGRLALLVLLVLVPLALAVLLAARGVKTFHPRYLIAFFPLFVALAAAGWARGGRLVRGAGIAALALIAWSLANLWFSPAHAKEDSRAAAALVRREERPGDAVVVIYAFRPFQHYYTAAGGDPDRLHHVHKRFLRTDEDLRAHVADAARDAGRVWLVLSRWWDVAPEAHLRAAFESRLDEKARWEFPGVKVTLYDAGGGA